VFRTVSKTAETAAVFVFKWAAGSRILTQLGIFEKSTLCHVKISTLIVRDFGVWFPNFRNHPSRCICSNLSWLPTNRDETTWHTRKHARKHNHKKLFLNGPHPSTTFVCRVCVQLLSVFCLFLKQQLPVGQAILIREVSRSHTTAHHSR